MISLFHHKRSALMLVAVFAGPVLTTTARALTVPFTENFTTGTAQWFTNSIGTIAPTHTVTGGPDGGAFVSRAFNFGATTAIDTPILFRGQAAFGSSGNAFVGDWINDGVAELSAWVRHDAPVDLTLFARLTPAGATGVVGLSAPIAPGDWTKITLPIVSTSFINEGPPGAAFFNNVMSNVGNLQFGTLPGSLVGMNQDVVFDLDQVRIVPEPATLALLAGGGLFAAFGRWGRRAS